jgi:hypothetical protein
VAGSADGSYGRNDSDEAPVEPGARVSARVERPPAIRVPRSPHTHQMARRDQSVDGVRKGPPVMLCNALVAERARLARCSSEGLASNSFVTAVLV